jgi:hypothetical protein
LSARHFASGSGKEKEEEEGTSWNWRKSFDTAVGYARSSREKGCVAELICTAYGEECVSCTVLWSSGYCGSLVVLSAELSAILPLPAVRRKGWER